MANMQSVMILILSFTLLVTAVAGATQFKVGGSKGWGVPNDPNQYRHWAEKNRFQIGDSLLFVYQPDKDSVLLVNETSFRDCDTSSPVDRFDDGNTVFVFTRSGPYHFISGNRDNCRKNESLVVVVLADRSNRMSLAAPSPSPSSSSSPPPLAPAMEFMPTAAPNGAASQVVGLVGSLAALVGSLFFVF